MNSSTTLGIILLIVGVGLWFLNQRNIIKNETLDKVEKIASIIAVIGAISVLMFPLISNSDPAQIPPTRSSETITITPIPPTETPTSTYLTAKIFPNEGDVSTVLFDSFESNNCAGGGGYPELIFQGGRRIPFSEMKSFDVNTAFESEYTYTITMTMLDNSEQIEILSANYIGCYLKGTLVDRGELSLSMKDVNRVEFHK